MIYTLIALFIPALFAAVYFSQKPLKKRIQKLQEEKTQESLEKVKLQTQVDNLEEQKKTQEVLAQKFETQMKNQFHVLASEALKGNQKQFLDLAKATFQKEQTQVEGVLKQKEIKMENLLKPLQDILKQYESQIQSMEKQRREDYGSLDEAIKKIVESHHSLSSETKALKDALKKPHVRGRWGEVQLENCIQMAGMSEYVDTTYQVSQDTEEGRIRPDLVVKMPQGRVVLVDAKTPVHAFLEALESTTDEEKKVHMARHGQHLKDHVKKLAEKKYHENFKGSADFTVLFLPNESFLYAALETQRDVIEYALEKKILIATPPMFVGLLKVIHLGWNEEKLARNAQNISHVGAELHKRLCDFVESFDKVGKGLEQAQKAFETGRTRLQSRVITSAKKLEGLGAKSPKELPESVSVSEPSTKGTSQLFETTKSP